MAARLTDLATDNLGDLVVADGQLQLVDDAPALAQRIGHGLATFRGEWFLDPLFGRDYYGVVLKKAPDRGLVEAEMREGISYPPEVRSIRSLTGTFDAATRVFQLKFVVDSVFGPVAGAASPVV